MGLAQWLAPHDDLMARTMELARSGIAGLPPLATRLAKESLNRGMDIANIKDVLQADVYRFAVLSQTEDSLEAHRAWREKRPPEVRGR